MASREESVAAKISELLADVRLRRELIGKYLAQSLSGEMKQFLVEVIESFYNELEESELIMIDFDLKCQILAGVWLKSTELSDGEFVENNDVGLSLAFANVHGLISGLTERGSNFIEASFSALLENYEISEKEIIGADPQAIVDSIN